MAASGDYQTEHMRMLEEQLQEMRTMIADHVEGSLARGEAVSALFAAEAPIYGRFGYGLAGDAHQYHFPPSALPPSDARAAVEIMAWAGASNGPYAPTGWEHALLGRLAGSGRGELKRRRRCVEPALDGQLELPRLQGEFADVGVAQHVEQPLDVPYLHAGVPRGSPRIRRDRGTRQSACRRG